MDNRDPRIDALRNRARRFTKKGEHRKAALAIRESVALRPDAASYALLGASLKQARRQQEALDAFRQSLWLHRRNGQLGRARSVAQLMLDLDAFDPLATRTLEVRSAA